MEISSELRNKINQNGNEAAMRNNAGLLQALQAAQGPDDKLSARVALYFTIKDSSVEDPYEKAGENRQGILQDYSMRPAVQISPGPVALIAYLTRGTVQDYIDILSDSRVTGISNPDVQIARGAGDSRVVR